MNSKPHKSKISVSQSASGTSWELPARKGVGFLMLFGCFFGGLPLLMLALTAYSYFFGSNESEFDSIWGLLALFGFLSIFILIGSVTFYFGMKMRYTAFHITTRAGSVEVLRKFLRKKTEEKLTRGSIHGVGLYSSSETNGKPDYGLIIKTKEGAEGKDIRISNSYKEDELRWLASEMLAELDQQGGLPTDQELEESYFRSDANHSSADAAEKFVHKGVSITLLDKSKGEHFVIEKNGSTIAKSMLFGGLFGIIFSSVFIAIGFSGFGADDGDLIFGIVGCLFATVSLVIFLVGLFRLGTAEKYTFKADTIVKEKIRGGVSKSKEVFRKSNYNKLTVASSGSSNNETRYSVKLMGAGSKKPLKLFSWVDQDVSDVVKLKVNAWLKPTATPEEPVESSFSNGYGSAMKTEASQQHIVEGQSTRTKIQPYDVPIYNANMNLTDVKGGVWMLRIFLSIFLFVGLGLLIFGVMNFMTAKDSENWPSTQGTILSSEITTNSSDDGTTYGADVSYRFVVEGKTYEGDKVTISEVSTSNRDRAVKIVNRYPVGKKIAVYYQPNNPEKNVLETGVSGGSWLLPGVGFVFFLVGFVALIVTETSRRKEHKKNLTNKHSMKNIQSRYGKME